MSNTIQHNCIPFDLELECLLVSIADRTIKLLLQPGYSLLRWCRLACEGE